jgi:hypothetical protein
LSLFALTVSATFDLPKTQPQLTLSMARQASAGAYVITLLAGLTTSASLRLPPELQGPDLRPYDPVEVLCTLGTEVQGWCKEWVGCISTKSQPGCDASAVKAAWGPADCKEVCGIWPVTLLQQQGSGDIAKVNASASSAAKLFGLMNRTSTRRECETSCENFEESLSSCMATVLFNPGQVAAMGMPDASAKPAPAHCTGKDTTCMPDVPILHQKCLIHKTKKTIDSSYKAPEETVAQCEAIARNYEDCKDCPQLSEGYTGHYHAFVGGCMAQLHAYHTATEPGAGVAAIPGATGCLVH